MNDAEKDNTGNIIIAWLFFFSFIDWAGYFVIDLHLFEREHVSEVWKLLK